MDGCTTRVDNDGGSCCVGVDWKDDTHSSPSSKIIHNSMNNIGKEVGIIVILVLPTSLMGTFLFSIEGRDCNAQYAQLLVICLVQ